MRRSVLPKGRSVISNFEDQHSCEVYGKPGLGRDTGKEIEVEVRNTVYDRSSRTRYQEPLEATHRFSGDF